MASGSPERARILKETADTTERARVEAERVGAVALVPAGLYPASEEGSAA